MSSQNPPPPELRVLCRTLASTPPAQLLTKLPVLTSLLVRSSDAFSAAAASSKPRPDASPSSQLLRKLFTHLTSLLTGRSREGRFVSAALLKAVVDLGRWNVLPDSEPWVRGLLSVLQVRVAPLARPYSYPSSAEVASDPNLDPELFTTNSTRPCSRIHGLPESWLSLPSPAFTCFFIPTRLSSERLSRLRCRPLRRHVFNSSSCRHLPAVPLLPTPSSRPSWKPSST